MTHTPQTFTVSDAGLDIAREVSQLCASAISMKPDPQFPQATRVTFWGRHADEAASLFTQMILRRR